MKITHLKRKRKREGERKRNKFDSIWSFNICQLVSNYDWFKTKHQGFCGLKSLGCLAWAWETCATSRWYWRSRLQHLGFPHASPCWRQLGQPKKLGPETSSKGSNWGILRCCFCCSEDFWNKQYQKTFSATFQETISDWCPWADATANGWTFCRKPYCTKKRL